MRATEIAAMCIALGVCVSALGQADRKPALAADPVAAVIEAFESHPVVALAEGDHNNEQGHALRLVLVRDPRFAATVDDIVVEFGNARYQSTIDRFVAGGDVPYDELNQVWRNTSQAGAVWDVPIYEEFFRAVRAVNAVLPAEQRLRVLLGDPPIDWTRVTRLADVFSQMREVGDRDAHAVALIQREVVAKRRRALVIYGGEHLGRTPPALRPGCQPGSTIPCYPGGLVDQLEAATGMRTFTIQTITGSDLKTLDASVASWRIPALASLRGTSLGAASYRAFFPPGPLMIGPDGRPQTESPAMSRPIEDVFDAVLYLGPPATITYSRLAPQTCADAAYVEMRRARLAIAPLGQAAALCAE
jgi:hypothetical protein